MKVARIFLFSKVFTQNKFLCLMSTVETPHTPTPNECHASHNSTHRFHSRLFNFSFRLFSFRLLFYFPFCVIHWRSFVWVLRICRVFYELYYYMFDIIILYVSPFKSLTFSFFSLIIRHFVHTKHKMHTKKKNLALLNFRNIYSWFEIVVYICRPSVGCVFRLSPLFALCMCVISFVCVWFSILIVNIRWQ